MEVSPKIRNLSSYLSKQIRGEITQTLLATCDSKKELAQEIGASYPTVKKWSQGSTPGVKYFPKILKLALNKSLSVSKLFRKELIRFQALCKELGIRYEEPSGLFSQLDRKSVKILSFVQQNHHADIKQLAKLIGANGHNEVLGCINKVINPQAQKFLGEPILKFKECSIDPLTGESVTFSWWLTRMGEEALASEKGLPSEELIDVINEGNCLTIVYSLPDDDFSNPKAEAKFKNGLLSVHIHKSKQGR